MLRTSTSIPVVLIIVAFARATLMALASCVAAILPAHADSSAKSAPAESYIADFFRATVETAVAPQSGEYATKAVKTLLLRAIPLDETARFMLGRNWPTDNTAAARRFQEQFHDFVAEAVTNGLRANPTVALAVTGSRSRADGSTLVLSTLTLPSGRGLPVDWRLTQNPATGTFQVTGISVAGLDAAIVLRSVAADMLADGRTQVDDLIPRLRASLTRHTGETVASP